MLVLTVNRYKKAPVNPGETEILVDAEQGSTADLSMASSSLYELVESISLGPRDSEDGTGTEPGASDTSGAPKPDAPKVHPMTRKKIERLGQAVVEAGGDPAALETAWEELADVLLDVDPDRLVDDLGPFRDLIPAELWELERLTADERAQLAELADAAADQA